MPDVRRLKRRVRAVLPEKTIWLYTGHEPDEIPGPYIEAERDISLPFRGSRNQQIIDCP